MVSGKERNWKTEDKWVSGRVLIIWEILSVFMLVEKVYKGQQRVKIVERDEKTGVQVF